MLLTRQSRQPRRPELNMASMIDVVFLLLIFFMCTSSFEMLENDLPAQAPQASSGQPQEQPDFEPVRISLSRVGNTVVIMCGDEPCGTVAGLIGKLKTLRAVDDVPVVIQGERTVPFGDMVAALDACYQADLRRVAFSAKGVGN